MWKAHWCKCELLICWYDCELLPPAHPSSRSFAIWEFLVLPCPWIGLAVPKRDCSGPTWLSVLTITQHDNWVYTQLREVHVYRTPFTIVLPALLFLSMSVLSRNLSYILSQTTLIIVPQRCVFLRNFRLQKISSSAKIVRADVFARQVGFLPCPSTRCSQ